MVFEACELLRSADEFSLARSTVELLRLSEQIAQAHTVGRCHTVFWFKARAKILILIWSYRYICDAQQLLIIKLNTLMVKTFTQTPFFQSRNLRLNSWTKMHVQHLSPRWLISINHLLCLWLKLLKYLVMKNTLLIAVVNII